MMHTCILVLNELMSSKSMLCSSFAMAGLHAISCYTVLCYDRVLFNTLRPRQNGRRFADNTLKCIFLNEYVRISFKISLQFVPLGPINNIPALVQLMAWRRPGDKPLSEPMIVSLPMHICVIWSQWVKDFKHDIVVHCEISLKKGLQR